MGVRHLIRLVLVLTLAAWSTAAAATIPEPSRLPMHWAEPPILMYHRVDPVPASTALGRQLTVTPEQLRAQLRVLRQLGYEAISMADLQARLEDGQPVDHVAVLTFDDGYADQYDYALPLLKDAGARATFYIVTGNVGTPNHLTWDEIGEMLRAGMDMGAHGLQHLELPSMTAAEQERQIAGSIAALEAHTGVPVESYAYPSGRFDERTLAIVARLGVAMALTTDPVPNQNRFNLGRLRVLGSWTAGDFEAAVKRTGLHEALVSSAP